jgi:hypothetical protein
MRRNPGQHKRDAQARPGFNRYRVPTADNRMRRYVQADMGRQYQYDRSQFGENKDGTTNLNLYGRTDVRNSVTPQYTGATAPAEAVLYGALILQPVANNVMYYRWRTPSDVAPRGTVRFELVLFSQVASVDLASLTVSSWEVRHGSELRSAAVDSRIFDVPLLSLLTPTPITYQYTLSGVSDEIHFKVEVDNIVTTGGTLAILGASVAYTSQNNHRHTP